ncbi:hypothetical protein AX15_005952 [Amanita polypyramis BW_CC]|nr:hypothetical protein AX15_005952 [Amanita polypyramis BW_CC]
MPQTTHPPRPITTTVTTVATVTVGVAPTTSLSPPPQLSQPITSSAPLSSPLRAHRRVGATVGGIVGGIFAGIIVIVLLANAIVFLYRRLRPTRGVGDNSSRPAPWTPAPAAVVEKLEKARAVPTGPPEDVQATLAAPAENVRDMPARPSESSRVTLSGPSETTQVSIPGEGTHVYQQVLSSDALSDDRSVVVLPSSVVQDVTTPDPGTNRQTIHFARTRLSSRTDAPTSPLAGNNRNSFLIPSDPFASIRRQRHRLSRPDNDTIPVAQLSQQTIPEQDAEFLAQEVVAFMLTSSMEQPTSRRNSYSSPPIVVEQPSPTLALNRTPTWSPDRRSGALGSGSSSPALRYSPILGSVRRSVDSDFSRTPTVALRHLSRGSSMEGW